MKNCLKWGDESSNKTLKKRNVERLFCTWCGNEIKENADKCTNCNEKIKPSIFDYFIKVLKYVFILVNLLYICFIVEVDIKSYRSTLLFTLVIVLLLPIVVKTIKNKTIGKKKIRVLINVVRGLLVFILFFAALINIPDDVFGDIPYEASKEEATEMAEIVFHEEVNLNNEQSFVINDSSLNRITYNDDENLQIIMVTLDYSSQNAFGEMNRNEYIVELLYDTSDGHYYRINRNSIN